MGMTALVIKVLLNSSEAAAGAVRLSNTLTSLAVATKSVEPVAQQVTTTTNALTTAMDSANSSAKSWAIGLLGVASAGAVMTSAIKAASDAEQRLGVGRDAEKAVEPVDTLARSYGQLKTAVDRAYETFGTAFAQSADLQKTLDLLRGAVQNVTKILGFLGSVLGTVVGWFVNTPPVLLAVVAALKILTAVTLFYVQYLLTRWIVAWVTLKLTGTAMTTMMLVKTAVMWGLSAAYTAASVACGLLSAAMGVLMAVGFPIWAALAIIVGVIALAIAAVVAIVWGLVKAWEAFTTNDEEADKIAKLEDLQAKMQELSRDAGQMVDDVQKAIDQFGMTETAKKVDDFKRKFAELRAREGDQAFAERVAVYQQMLEKLQAMEDAEKKNNAAIEAGRERNKARLDALKDAQQMVADLGTKLEQVGWTEQQKALDDFVTKLDQYGFLTDKQRQAMIDQFEAQQQQITAAENRLKVEKEIADLQKAAAEVGMTDAERKIAALQALGATAEQIAAAQAALNKKNAAEEKAKLVERGKQLTDSLATPAEKYRQKMAEISKLLANKAISDQTALKAADAAAKEYESSLANNQQGREISSPQALLRGTAEALLAADRQKNPIDKLTDIQRQALKEAKEQTDIQRTKLQEIIDGDQTVDFN